MIRPAVALLGLLAASAVAAGAVGDLTRVSVVDGGALPVEGALGAPAVSADGRFVAFTSVGRLAPLVLGGTSQLFVRDRESGRTILASSAADGRPASADVDSDASRPAYALSADGRYVVFSSTAPNLVADDRNGGARDVFRKDLQTGAVAIVSRGPGGAQAEDGVLGQPDISADGNRVVFATGAAGILTPDRNLEVSDIVMRDVRAARTILVSRTDAGAPGNGDCTRPAISADGTTVAFEAAATGSNLVAGDANGEDDIVVRDLRAAVTRLGTVAADGERPGDATLGDVSGDGREVVFTSVQPYVGGDANGAADVFLARPFAAAPATTLVSRVASGTNAGAGASSGPTITADGTRVAFTSTATDLVPGDLNGPVADVYVATVGGATTRESTRLDGSQRSRPAGPATIAGDGSALAFAYSDGSPSDPLLTGDENGVRDLFARERVRVDAAGPLVTLLTPANGARVSSPRVLVSGTVSDPSGVASVTVDGRPATVLPDGGFAARLPISGDALVAVRATDGVGNTVERTVRVSQSAPAPSYGAAPASPRVRNLRVRRAGRVVEARFDLDSPAIVRTRLLRRVRVSDRVAGWRPLGPWEARVREGGAHLVRIEAPRLGPGTYQVRVSALAGGVRQAVAPLLVPRPGRREPR